MKVYMDYSDFVGNLVLLLNRNDFDMEHIPFYLLDKYISLLANKFKENNMEYYFHIGMNEEDYFYDEYKDYFVKNNELNTIDIIKDPSIEYLHEFFRARVTVDAYDILDDDSILIELLQTYREEVKKEQAKELQKINNKILKLVMSESKTYKK